MIAQPLYIILPIVFLFMVFFVGSYVFMMLGIMRADQNDVESRKKQGYNQDIIPKKIDLDENEEKANEEKTQDEEVKNEKKSKEE